MKRKSNAMDEKETDKKRKKVDTLPSIGSFTILPIPISSSSPFKRFLYLTQHRSSHEESNGCTIFITNLPQSCNEGFINELFSSCGEITSIVFNYLRGGLVSSAHVTFRERKSLTKVFSLNPPANVILEDEGEDKSQLRGFKKWMNDLKTIQKVPRDVLKEDADSFMALFERMEEEEKEELKKKVAQEASEGWTLVTHKGKRNKEDVRKVRHKKKEKKKELSNFYSSQIREAKRDQLAILREKFQKDKERIVKLKAARKFNPFASS